MVEAPDGTQVGIAYTTLQVQAGTERTGTLRTASTVDGESGGDTVTISDEGRRKAEGMKSSGAGGTQSTEKSDSDDKLASLKEQIQKLQEQIRAKQQELSEIQQDGGMDAEQKQQQVALKMSEITMLQSQLMELTKQKAELENGGSGSSGGAAGVSISV
ncbi:hypothetical protein ACR4XJ_03040 [Nitratidesulfovibrio sp. D1]|uniref:hypothetical protein n=1 Tax=Nitratidesulfovibrio sp. D1 TaxID=3440151 RepID=UPI003EB9A67D